MTTGTELVDALADVWDSIDALAGSLSEDEFQRPTDCPGWSVQDNIVHIYAVESMLLGEPMPDHEIADDLEHVKNDFGRINDTRPGYGYAGLVDPYRDELAPEGSGIWRVDLATGITDLIITLAQIAAIPYPRGDYSGYKHWFNHLLFLSLIHISEPTRPY